MTRFALAFVRAAALAEALSLAINEAKAEAPIPIPEFNRKERRDSMFDKLDKARLNSLTGLGNI